MSPDEQESASIRYGPQGLTLVPLSSGRWAIWINYRETLVGIWEQDEIPFDRLRQMAKIELGKCKVRREMEQAPISLTESLEDLGL